MPEKNEIIRLHIWISGRVQGVGFRAHAEYHARQLGGLTGWVRNVGNDVVEIVAEGQKSVVEKFSKLARQGPRGAHVNESRLEQELPTGEFSEFTVKRSL